MNTKKKEISLVWLKNIVSSKEKKIICKIWKNECSFKF